MAKKDKKDEQQPDFIEKIEEQSVAAVVPDYMLAYAAYTNTERGIPRIEDGLKPVQRRILYVMHELGMRPSSPHKKSARVVGEVLGKSHPHGDQSVYQAAVNMAQDWKMRAPFIDGHGNFGSQDGDGAAAMRYTEMRLAPVAMEFFQEYEKGIVPYKRNFDDTLEEPELLPARFPNLIVNGITTGIGVAAASSIPPHNLGEVVDACILLIDKPDAKLEDILKVIKGPDFPTGGYCEGGDAIFNLYSTGKGSLKNRAKYTLELGRDGIHRFIINEFPYGSNKAEIQMEIAEKIKREAEKFEESKKPDKNKKLVIPKANPILSVDSITDESDRNGIRVVIALKKGADEIAVENELLSSQQYGLQIRNGYQFYVVKDHRLKIVKLHELLKAFLTFRRGIIKRRTERDLNKAKADQHIYQGYITILIDLDEFLQIVRSHKNKSESKPVIRARWGLSDLQAEAALALTVNQLHKDDVLKFQVKCAEIDKLVAELQKILGSDKLLDSVMKNELKKLKDSYADPRRTVIVDSLDIAQLPKAKDETPEVVTQRTGFFVIDNQNAVKFITTKENVNRLGATVEMLSASALITARAEQTGTDNIIAVGSSGKGYTLNSNNIAPSKYSEIGKALHKLFIKASASEKAIALIKLTDSETPVYFTTKLGKLVAVAQNKLQSNNEVYGLIGLGEGDEVVSAFTLDAENSIFAVTSDGNALAIKPETVPVQGKGSSGVNGVNLNDGQTVIFAGGVLCDDTSAPVEMLVLAASDGYGKRLHLREFISGNRDRKGNKIIELTPGVRLSAVFIQKEAEARVVLGEETADKPLLIKDTDLIPIMEKEQKGRSLFGRGITVKNIYTHIL
ncbi:MAG: hypothetical protein LBN25_00410 [Christensenellaceae bacterium]|jgi:DNA gyrase subunit A|nr:hypothetical protein [Christensenellaceae bacterium]